LKEAQQNTFQFMDSTVFSDTCSICKKALQSEDNGIIRFFCRYQSDIQRTEAKINDFASNHCDACEAIAIS
jgi:hypothetical protein